MGLSEKAPPARLALPHHPTTHTTTTLSRTVSELPHRAHAHALSAPADTLTCARAHPRSRARSQISEIPAFDHSEEDDAPSPKHRSALQIEFKRLEWAQDLEHAGAGPRTGSYCEEHSLEIGPLSKDRAAYWTRSRNSGEVRQFGHAEVSSLTLCFEPITADEFDAAARAASGPAPAQRAEYLTQLPPPLAQLPPPASVWPLFMNGVPLEPVWPIT